MIINLHLEHLQATETYLQVPNQSLRLCMCERQRGKEYKTNTLWKEKKNEGKQIRFGEQKQESADPTSFHSGSRLLSITLVFLFSPVNSKKRNGEREKVGRGLQPSEQIINRPTQHHTAKSVGVYETENPVHLPSPNPRPSHIRKYGPEKDI